MGLWISKLWSLFGDQEARILVLGLDNAGEQGVELAAVVQQVEGLTVTHELARLLTR
jgi:hypothetical protein